MSRFAPAILFLVGASLLLTLQVSPATSAPMAPTFEAPSPFQQVVPLLTEVDAQVARLRERLDAPRDYPPPTRDPFTFGTRRVVPPVTAVAPPAPVSAPVVEPPIMPRLVAVLSNEVNGTWQRTAAFAAGDDVQMLAVGERVSGFIVRAIAAETVTLEHVASGATFRVQ